MKYSAGPWVIDNGPKTLDSDHRFREIHSLTGGKTGDGNVIATVHGDIFNHTVPFEHEAMANAKLISAAPELLEALQALLDAQSLKGSLIAAIERAQEAIKNATV